MFQKHSPFYACILIAINFSCTSNAKEERAVENKSVEINAAPALALKKVCEGIVSPVNLAVANDGTNRLFINEQPGKVVVVKEGKVLPVPFLDFKGKVIPLENTYAESGLLGLVFHPKYKENGRFFVYYTAPSKNSSSNQKSVISEFKVSSNPDVALMASEKIIMEVEQPEWNHNGGQLEFGPDGFLYIGLGDGGGGGDKHGKIGNGQNLNTLLGKILRINVDKAAPYSIPADNPLVGKEGRKEIWAWGLRNPWRFSFDKANGRLFCGDVGQNKYEEVNIIEKGKNYGWRAYEGKHVYDDDLAKTVKGEMPIDEYDRDFGSS
ncbi:MAG TPA: PQQ-dependent sugar dehydrogenase, partial [Cytophagaceae bacterium]